MPLVLFFVNQDESPVNQKQADFTLWNAKLLHPCQDDYVCMYVCMLVGSCEYQREEGNYLSCLWGGKTSRQAFTGFPPPVPRPFLFSQVIRLKGDLERTRIFRTTGGRMNEQQLHLQLEYFSVFFIASVSFFFFSCYLLVWWLFYFKTLGEKSVQDNESR